MIPHCMTLSINAVRSIILKRKLRSKSLLIIFHVSQNGKNTVDPNQEINLFCGINTRVEDWVGADKDDTTLHDIEHQCCEIHHP